MSGIVMMMAMMIMVALIAAMIRVSAMGVVSGLLRSSHGS